MTLSTTPCGTWPVYWGKCDVSASSPAATGMAVSMATNILWSLSGRRFGTCPAVLRPCREDCYDRWPTATPYLPWSAWGGTLQPGWNTGWDAGFWFGESCGTCSGSCSCGPLPQIRLPALANSIVQVKVDGASLPATGAYRLDDNRLLVRTDGQRWPRCNNLLKDDTQPGTWSVTALFGADVPADAAVPMGALACEILRSLNGQDCSLPMSVQAIVRQGVSVSFPDVNAAMDNGRTGIRLVDLWLGAVNPNRLTNRSRIYSPDGPVRRRAGT